MNIKKIVNNYLEDNNYKIIIKNNIINIINYTEIIDFNSTNIIVLVSTKKITLKGNNLIIKKMYDEELEITGTVSNIIIN